MDFTVKLSLKLNPDKYAVFLVIIQHFFRQISLRISVKHNLILKQKPHLW